MLPAVSTAKRSPVVSSLLKQLVFIEQLTVCELVKMGDAGQVTAFKVLVIWQLSGFQ